MSDGGTYRVGVDIGGTHTDFAMVTPEGDVETYKVSTTPGRLSGGVIEGLTVAADDRNLDLGEFLSVTDRIVHGTTVTTNALLEDDEATTGLLTTEGMRDVIELNMERDPDIYDLWSDHKDPGRTVIERSLRRPVPERVDDEGRVREELDESDVTRAVDRLVDEGAECVAVAFMNSYLDDRHERAAERVLADREDVAAVSVSTAVFPQIGLYDRITTTVIDASLKPVLREYLGDLESSLRDAGFDGTFLIMKGNGGVSLPEVLAEEPVLSVNSGPAAATVGNAATAGVAGFEDIISVDMGGTSTDVCLITEGTPLVTTDNSVGTKRVPVSMVDINTIGAGGGSIAWLDGREVLQIGPKSAGADPGPICYGQGGDRPTVTDANLLLGYLNPEFFLGGETSLDVEAARRGIRERLADPLGIDVEEACAGVVELMNEQLINQIRQVSIQRGYDPREFALVTVGGAGPLHVGPLARRFETTAIVPETAGTLSASGLLQSDIKHNFVRSFPPEPLSGAVLERVKEAFEEMEAEARETLREEDTPEESWSFERTVSTRYEGQVHYVDVEVPPEVEKLTDVGTIEDYHHEQHEKLYTFCDEESAVEVVNIRLTAVAETEKPRLAGTGGGVDPAEAVKDHRDVYFPARGEFVRTPIYDGRHDVQGDFEGPGVVEFPHTTLVVPPAFDASVDRRGNYVLRPEGVGTDGDR
ncbi:hypothetical protein BRD00_07490 [Halobacteriales archaeon QS_8_69_26]|nr:MAG: hypothetical protein BRD00_07490 [Halobacteriales archaeon QS_8_69_26]